MDRFIQLHLLTSYPPANLNRDDLGRPKTAMMGGIQRLRISSQNLKRAWRESDLFAERLKGNVGIRTRDMGKQIFTALTTGNSLNKVLAGDEHGLGTEVKEKDARAWARQIAAVFGKPEELSAEEKKKLGNKETPQQEREKLENKLLKIKQLAHSSPDEIALIDELVTRLIAENRPPEDNELNLLRKQHHAADIALFGRMLADVPSFNMEAAAQVAHAITVHDVTVEDDFFTAVDDLNRGEEDMGAGHMGETEFAAGLFYLYLCIDRALLKENLGDDEALTKATLTALVEAAAMIAPSGKQNSFASRARASYILCERGDQQPRSLSVAFLKPVKESDMLPAAIGQL